MVTVELLRTGMTYLIALVVIIGGGWLLVTPSQVPPEQLLPFLTGIVGTVIAFVFAERQQAASTTASVAATKAANGGTVDHAAIVALHKRLDEMGAPSSATPSPGAIAGMVNDAVDES